MDLLRESGVAQAKMQITDTSVDVFLAQVAPVRRHEEALVLDALFRRVTGASPRIWGNSIVGYGEYRTIYASGRKVHWMRSGFSPKKDKHSLHLMGGYCDPVIGPALEEKLGRLGRHSTGKSCLYVNKLADIDLAVLEEIIAADWEAMQRLFPES